MSKKEWKPKVLAVLQLETGRLDGWYGTGNNMDEILPYWDEAYPGYTHIVIGVYDDKKKCLRMTNDKYLRHPDRLQTNLRGT